METNNRLAVLLKNPTKTGNAIDSILKEIKEESTKIYDEVFKDFSMTQIYEKKITLLK